MLLYGTKQIGYSSRQDGPFLPAQDFPGFPDFRFVPAKVKFFGAIFWPYNNKLVWSRWLDINLFFFFFFFFVFLWTLTANKT